MRHVRGTTCLLFCFILLSTMVAASSTLHVQAQTETCAAIDIPEPSSNTAVSPICAVVGTEIQVEVAELPPNEPVQLTFVWPNGAIAGPTDANTTDAQGYYRVGFPTQGLSGGLWEVRLIQTSTQVVLARFYYMVIGEEGEEITIPPPMLMPRLVPDPPQEKWSEDMDPETYRTADEAIAELNALGYSSLQIIIRATRDGRYPRNMVWTTNPTADQLVAKGQIITLEVIRHGEDKGPGGGDLENP